MLRQGQVRRRGKHNGLQRQNTSVLRMNTTFRPRRKKFTERCVNSLQQHVTKACVQTPRSPSCPAHPARCEARLFLRTRESRYKQRLIHTHDHRVGGQPFTIRMGHGFHLNIPTIRADHQQFRMYPDSIREVVCGRAPKAKHACRCLHHFLLPQHRLHRHLIEQYEVMRGRIVCALVRLHCTCHVQVQRTARSHER